MESTIILSTNDGEMEAFVASNNSDAQRAIVVIQEAFGLTNHIKNICRRLSDAGYLAIAPALFHRVGSPIFDYTDYEGTKPAMDSLNARDLTTDVDATFDYLQSQNFSQSSCGIIGFCMGGTVSFMTATQRSLGAAVTFYGGGIEQGRFEYSSLLDESSKLQTPWQGHYGDEDKGIPSEQVEKLRVALKKANVPTDINRYPEAGHGFSCNDRSTFHAPSAALAWERTLSWFDQHVSKTS